MSETIRSHKQLLVFQRAFQTAARIYDLTRSFPKEETYALTDQIRRSSRAVSALVAEAWRRRRYRASFINKLTEAEGEVAATQVWLAHAACAGYISTEECQFLDEECEAIIRTLVGMINNVNKWVIALEQDHK